MLWCAGSRGAALALGGMNARPEMRSIWSAETLVGGLAGVHHQPALLLTKTEFDEDLKNELQDIVLLGHRFISVSSQLTG